jgi:hypothetical protein
VHAHRLQPEGVQQDLPEDRLRVEWAVVIADTAMVAADEQVAKAIVLPDDGVQHGLAIERREAPDPEHDEVAIFAAHERDSPQALRLPDLVLAHFSFEKESLESLGSVEGVTTPPADGLLSGVALAASAARTQTGDRVAATPEGSSPLLAFSTPITEL